MAPDKAIPSGLRMFAKLDEGHPVSSSLMVDFKSHRKVNHKILWSYPYWLLCLKNRQIGPSALEIGLIERLKRIVHRLIHRKCGTASDGSSSIPEYASAAHIQKMWPCLFTYLTEEFPADLNALFAGQQLLRLVE